MTTLVPTYTPALLGVGDWVTLDGKDYRLAEYDEATEQFFAIRYGADAGEFVDALRLEYLLRAGVVTLAVRQLPLTGLGGQDA